MLCSWSSFNLHELALPPFQLIPCQPFPSQPSPKEAPLPLFLSFSCPPQHVYPPPPPRRYVHRHNSSEARGQHEFSSVCSPACQIVQTNPIRKSLNSAPDLKIRCKTCTKFRLKRFETFFLVPDKWWNTETWLRFDLIRLDWLVCSKLA